MTLFLVELSPEVAGHLAVAIELYRRELRKASGWAGPELLDDLGVMAQKNARGRQEVTAVLDLVDLLEDGRIMPLLLSKTAAAQALGVSLRTLHRLIAAGSLPAVTVEGRVLIRRSDLEAYAAGLGPHSFRDGIATKVAPASPGLAGTKASGSRPPTGPRRHNGGTQ